MHIVMTGGTGFVGQELARRLLERGDEVTVLSRSGPKAASRVGEGVQGVKWTPYELGDWASSVDGADAVVHLAGEPVAQRWSDEVKERIRRSRIESTEKIVEAMAKAKVKPKVFVCASAIGYYGSLSPDAPAVDESSPPGDDFLADVVVGWEKAAAKAAELGIRVVNVRIGIVLDKGGGALEKMLLPFKMMMGGPIADGRQMVSWIHRDDVVGLLVRSIDDGEVSGPINAVAPRPVSNKELSDAIGRALHRPSWLRVPKLAVKAAMGEAADALTSGQTVHPREAERLGYQFQYRNVDDALTAILG